MSWGLAAALFAARMLVPTEASVFGETLWITQGWFVVALLWGCSAFGQGTVRVRYGWTDLAIGLLVLGHVIGAIGVLWGAGDKRSAMNLLWEWLALGVSYAWFRQAVVQAIARQHWTAAFLALIVALAGFGIWQRVVWYPEAVARYSEVRDELDKVEAQTAATGSSPEAVRRGAELRQQLFEQGVTEQMQSGAGRMLFEGRLKDSREPFGKFALANTFAGLLLVGSVLLLAVLAELVSRPGSRQWSELAATALALGLMGCCLLLTKSRTAFLGTAAALVILAGSRFWMRSPAFAGEFRRRLVFGVGAGLAVLALTVAGLALSGGLDRYVLTEAPKSLQYRLEYWQGTWQIIRRHPLVGVGPGNFRQHYLQFKLPQASEEIADPHNLFFDAWTSGGLLAASGALGLWVVAVRLVLCARKIEPNRDDFSPTMGTDFRRDPAVWGTALVIVGLYLWSLALDQSLPAIGLGCGILLAITGRAWSTCALSAAVCGATLLGLLVHLLGAGGMGMPAVVQITAWLLALGLATVDRDRESTWRPRTAGIASTLLAAGLSIGCYFMATRPVSLRDAALESGDYARTPRQREAAYRQAAAADPWSPLPWERLAGTRFQQWEAGGDRDESLFMQALQFEREAIRRDPLNFAYHRTLGELAWKKYQRLGNRTDAAVAAASWTTAAGLYPNSAALQAQLAAAQAAAGDHQHAKQAAQRALQLDAINHAAGHRDKFLSAPSRLELDRISTEPP